VENDESEVTGGDNNARLMLVFGSGRAAAFSMEREAAVAMLELISKDGNVCSGISVKAADHTVENVIHCFIRGSAVTHAIVVPQAQGTPLQNLFPSGFWDNAAVNAVPDEPESESES